MMVDVGQDTLAWTQSGPGGGAVLFERVTGKKGPMLPQLIQIYSSYKQDFSNMFFLISLKLQPKRDLEILSSLKKTFHTPKRTSLHFGLFQEYCTNLFTCLVMKVTSMC